jgi:DNA-binding transcriptional LysR family regulator
MQYSPEAMEAFAAAAALGSFSAAARQLHKSQSTISAAIANLEADLDLTLFDRSNRLPVLTAAGRRVGADGGGAAGAGACAGDSGCR